MPSIFCSVFRLVIRSLTIQFLIFSCSWSQKTLHPSHCTFLSPTNYLLIFLSPSCFCTFLSLTPSFQGHPLRSLNKFSFSTSSFFLALFMLLIIGTFCMAGRYYQREANRNEAQVRRFSSIVGRHLLESSS